MESLDKIPPDYTDALELLKSGAAEEEVARELVASFREQMEDPAFLASLREEVLRMEAEREFLARE